jgi:hypothetical protein
MNGSLPCVMSLGLNTNGKSMNTAKLLPMCSEYCWKAKFQKYDTAQCQPAETCTFALGLLSAQSTHTALGIKVANLYSAHQLQLTERNEVMSYERPLCRR